MLHTSQNISIFSYTILIILQAINSILLLKIQSHRKGEYDMK
jgi:hypothetical protein